MSELKKCNCPLCEGRLHWKPPQEPNPLHVGSWRYQFPPLTGKQVETGHYVADVGWLVPDTRLQAIADAWSKYRSPEGWVEGIVPILDLLDALVEEPIDTVSRIGREQDAMEER